MHIEPGVVDGAKLLLGAGTGIACVGIMAKMAIDTIKKDGGLSALLLRTAMTTVLVFCFFQVLPHYPVGVSEVHLILGSTLFMMFGRGPAAIGLALGLLLQGLSVAPTDLPQYGMNVTSLVIPLIAVSTLAKRIVPSDTAYKDIKYRQALALSAVYQAGVVGWVAFWAFYGQGFGVESLVSVGSFAAAYMTVAIIEPIADIGILASVKAFSKLDESKIFTNRFASTAA